MDYQSQDDTTDDNSSTQYEGLVFNYTGQRRFEIPSNITVLTIEESLLFAFAAVVVERIEEAAFADQHKLRSALIPSTVQRIERAAFANCSLLNDLELVEGQLEAIESMAFARCTSISEISIPSTVEEIGDHAFLNCTGLVNVNFQRDGTLKKICEYAFRKCEALQKVAIPPSVNRIEEFSFDGCSSLVELSLSVGLQDICRNAFSMCVSLKTVDIPSTVIVLSEGAFANCKALVEVNMVSGLEEIRANVFEGCCSLQAVAIPDTVSWIGDMAFNFCIALVSVELLPTTTEIRMGEAVFNMCKNLVNISIPSTFNDLEEGAFVGCTLLQQKYAGRQITEALKERFQGYPIHDLCYHASTTTEKELVSAAAAAENSGDDNRASPDDLVDVFGMTPFHILASGKQHMDLFRTLMNLYPTELLSRKDRRGNSPLGYLCIHVSKEAHALFQTIVQQEILDIANQLGLQKWRMEILDMANPLQDGHEEWSSTSYINRRKCVETVYTKLEKYIIVEKTSLLEEALWKANNIMDDSITTTTTSRIVDRRDARFTSGASIVIPQVTIFLGYTYNPKKN
ncbi:unnamed protein product [Cylindrotheca closterium]|uniref:Uncharacterized protein n=1 Tax=Cylindrotheca closterium TaxID=2856 RepID=A0AAD2CDT2_9STRA|nr:unnamed protein product [Cylindrotheca closterium]